MSLTCVRCTAAVDRAERCVVYRNPDDGFALVEYRCPVCGHADVAGDAAAIEKLLSAGVRVIALRRSDEPDPEDAAVAELRALLDREDWPEVLFREPS